MRTSYHDDLDQIRADLVEMTRLVGLAVSRATYALVESSAEAAEQVISGDEAINALYREVEARSYELLARQQPVASDLRGLVSNLRMVVDLERAGDYAVHLAKIARRRAPQAAVPLALQDTVRAMGRVAEAITVKAGTVIATQNVGLAAELQDDDDDMDRLQRQLFHALLQQGDGDRTETAIDVTLAGRFYERLADHAVAVAGRVVFAVTGLHSNEAGSDAWGHGRHPAT